MPSLDSQDVRRDGRLPTGLFWSGVGLAPLAALLLLLGAENTLLRAGAVLAIASVVLFGFSITLRNNTEAVRAELEEAMYEEIDALRADVRQDITTAARATHKAFGEKFQLLSQQVHGVRTQLEAGGAAGIGYDRAVAAPAPAAAIGAGRAAPSGVVRHTETVQVTTRQTIVDPAHEDAGRGGTVYGGAGYGRQDQPDDGGWAEQRSSWAEGPPARPYQGQEPEYDDPRSEVRAGDRWGSIRDDDQGREVRVGARRAAMHTDDSGTEMRFEDRWASVRRDEPRRDQPRHGGYDDQPRDEPRRDEYRHDEYRHDEHQREEYRRDDSYDHRGGRYGHPGSDPLRGDGADNRSGRGSGEGAVGWSADRSAHRAGDDRWSGYDAAPELEDNWQRGHRAAPALPAGGERPRVWDADWAEAERQPVGGRRHRDEESDYHRYPPDPADRWR